MAGVGDALREANVAAIYLVHGTLVGMDALGILSQVSRIAPEASDGLGRLFKRFLNGLFGETGNYTPAFAREFERVINLDGSGKRFIPVRLFTWSSENHHLGRADAAVRLILELLAQEFQPADRVLLWGHSHAGNVFALFSQLVAGDRLLTKAFFDACRIHFQWPFTGLVDIPVWKTVEQLLDANPRPFAQLAVDMVTFGCPVRYGWNPSGFHRLMHFINYRSSPGATDGRAKFPPRCDEILSAKYGDYTQQIGISGTNTPPSPLAWRSWLANRNLDQLLEGSLEKQGLFEKLRCGLRAHDAGDNLMVDYHDSGPNVGRHVLGHAIYTSGDWLHFHATELSKRWYRFVGF